MATQEDGLDESLTVTPKIMNRHLSLALKVLRRTRINRALFLYIGNRLKLLRFDKLKQTEVPYPTGLMLELGNRCNLHCITCPREYVFGKAMDQGFMPLENVCKIVDEIYPYLDSIGLTGLGETFLHPQLAEIAKYIKSKRRNIIITVSTNAHFKGFLESVSRAIPYIDNIQFSVDGTGGVYEKIRPGTDFNFIKENIRQTVAMGRGVEFMINTVITPDNYTDVENIVRLASELGIKYVNFNRMNCASVPDKAESNKQFFTNTEFKQCLEKLSRLKKEFPGVTYTEDFSSKGFRDCTFPWHHQYITWDGYLVPCCAKPFPKEMNFGNVFTDGGVMNVLNSEKMQAFRRLWQKNSAPKFCETCNTIYLGR